MEIRQIEYIIAIAEEKSISKAAARLNISQPALSQQLLRLEERYGVTFFQRDSRNLRVTPAGEHYIENGRRILEIQKQTERELSEYIDSSRGSFTVGVSPGSCTSIIANIFPLFLERFPKYKIQIIEKPVSELQEMLLDDTLDLAFTAFLDNVPKETIPFQYQLLKHEEILLATSMDNPIAREAALVTQTSDIPCVDLARFADCDFALPPRSANLRMVADQSFAIANIRPNIVYEVHDPKPIINLVSNTDICTFLPASYTTKNDNIRFFHLTPQRYWYFSICWAKTHYIAIAEQYFIDLCYQNQQTKK